MKNPNQYAAQSKVVKAMAHPTRLFIVDMLTGEEKTVGALTQMIHADMSTVSKHLSVLKSAGILCDRKHHNQVFYRVALPCARIFLDCVRSIVRDATRQQIGLLGKDAKRQ